MGILDDAIREHLELKRRHGVPEEELQRQEDEALGPARRDVAQQHEEMTPGQTATAEVDEPAPPAAEQETALFDMEEAAAADAAESAEPSPAKEPASAADETRVHEGAAAAEPTPVEPPPVEPPPVEPEAPAVPDEAAVGEPGHEPDPYDALGDTEPHGFEVIEGEDEDEREADLERDEEDLPASDPEGDELDLLEDTPDFLQETPEHDRLWFEQKPPRDFDFD